MGLSHFHDDCNCDPHRWGIGVIVAILSHLDGSRVNHGKGFDTQNISSYNQIDFNPIDKSIAFIASDRNSSYEIAADRICSCAPIAAIAPKLWQGTRHDAIRFPTICCDLSRCSVCDLIRLVHEQIQSDTIRYG